jgi:hypothetical protein
MTQGMLPGVLSLSVRKQLKTEELSFGLDSSVRKRIKRKDLHGRARLVANGIEINIRLTYYIGIINQRKSGWVPRHAWTAASQPIGKSLPDGSSGQK